MSGSLDDEARVELLCFLVVGQLFAFAREGTWLRTDHLIGPAGKWPSVSAGRSGSPQAVQSEDRLVPRLPFAGRPAHSCALRCASEVRG
ncbi:hypothetical protein PWP93_35270 [Paraburkholderia sp. A1RI-2L]|uniref:hypothetical protein n=1 Tax=Paraburkholderia sp. A1RI-2L TaxID=3028367 RepID=UPI003B795C10